MTYVPRAAQVPAVAAVEQCFVGSRLIGRLGPSFACPLTCQLLIRFLTLPASPPIRPC